MVRVKVVELVRIHGAAKGCNAACDAMLSTFGAWRTLSDEVDELTAFVAWAYRTARFEVFSRSSSRAFILDFAARG